MARMARGERRAIPGTRRSPWPGAADVGPCDPKEEIPATIWLRPRRSGNVDRDAATRLAMLPPRSRIYADRRELARTTDAAPADVAAVRSYLEAHGIRVDATRWRALTANGTIGDWCAAFGTSLHDWEANGQRFRQRTGALHAPAAIAASVRGVFGLDEWPREHGMRPKAETAAGSRRHSNRLQPLSVAQLRRTYELPEGDGAGQVIGILQFGGSFEPADFAACMRWQGVPAPAIASRRIDAAPLRHRLRSSFDTELALDTQIAGALAPASRLVLYAAPHSERGFLDAVAHALFDNTYRPGIFSISFGWAEMYWTSAALELLDELFAAASLVGMSVFCASGDAGAEMQITGEPLVLAPASSPFVHACGATSLESADGSPASEHGWESTGGGFSDRFAAPAWQRAAANEARRLRVPGGRGVPDVCAQVQPGFRVVIGGERKAAGGTSAVAPFWAALTARFNQRLGVDCGLYAPLLYRKGAPLREIRTGTNGEYRAHAGWNACTGLGVPRGTQILRALRARDE